MIALLKLPAISESIARQFCELELDGAVILRHLLEWWNTRMPRAPLWVMTHNRQQAERLLPLYSSSPSRLVFYPPSTEAKAVDHIMSLVPSETDLMVIRPATIFLPDDLFDRIADHHESAGSDFTDVVHAPLYSSPYIVSRRLSAFLAQLPTGGEDLGVRSFVQRLLRVTARAEASDVPVNVRAEPFDFTAHYNVEPCDLPWALPTDNPENTGLLLAYLRRRLAAHSREEALGLLKQYKHDLVSRIERRYRALFRKRRSGGRQGGARRNFPMNVLFVSHCSAYSGAEECLVRLVEHLDRTRVTPHALVGMSGTLVNQLRLAGAHVHVAERPFADPTAVNVEWLRSVLSEVEASVIHLNGPCGQAVLLAAALQSVPIVQHLRGPNIEGLGESVYQAERIIAVSRYLSRIIQAHDIDGNKIRVVYDGINIDRFRPQTLDRVEARRRLGLPEHGRIILMIARLVPNKRHDVLIRAFQGIRERVANAYLALVGEGYGAGGYVESILSEIERAGVGAHVKFLGFQHDIRWSECASDLQVLCSENEPLGTCILESMALGIPVVISDGGGLQEIVEDGYSGFVVPVGQVEPLRDRCVALLEDDDLRARMGANARAVIADRYSAAHCAKQVTAIFDDVLNLVPRAIESRSVGAARHALVSRAPAGATT